MSFHVIRKGSLEYLSADALSAAPHAFTTRFGGVSGGALASLNLGVHRGDAPENVWENYRILGSAVGFSPEQTVFTRQEHTAIVRKVTRADCGCGLLREPEQPADALITNETGVFLVCFSADCTPVLLFDPEKRAVAAIHSGWRGTAAGIAAEAVFAMQREYGSDPAHLRAAIGPCIGPCCFETDRDVPDAIVSRLGAEALCAIRKSGEKYFVDLKACCRIWLQRAGVRQIDISEDCTRCQPERFWSHRAVGQARGSLAAVIGLGG